MKSKLFFLSLSTALAICANANAYLPEIPPEISTGPSYEIISVSDGGSGEDLDLSSFLDNARFDPMPDGGMLDAEGNYTEKLRNLYVRGNEDGTIDVSLNGFIINMKTPYPFSRDLYLEDNREDYLNAVLSAYEGLHDLGLLDTDEDVYQDIFGKLSDRALSGDYDGVCSEMEGCEDFAYSEDMKGWTIDDYKQTTSPSKPDNGSSDSNNGNQGSSGGEETKPDTGSSSGTGSSTGSGSGTTSGSDSSTTGTTTMPTGHRTFYAPAEAAADVHEGKDNSVIISF